jgi:hypothetical protein
VTSTSDDKKAPTLSKPVFACFLPHLGSSLFVSIFRLSLSVFLHQRYQFSINIHPLCISASLHFAAPASFAIFIFGESHQPVIAYHPSKCNLSLSHRLEILLVNSLCFQSILGELVLLLKIVLDERIADS